MITQTISEAPLDPTELAARQAAAEILGGIITQQIVVPGQLPQTVVTASDPNKLASFHAAIKSRAADQPAAQEKALLAA